MHSCQRNSVKWAMIESHFSTKVIKAQRVTSQKGLGTKFESMYQIVGPKTLIKKECTKRLTYWLDTDKREKETSEACWVYGRDRFVQVTVLPGKQAQDPTAEGNIYKKNWDTYCLCSRDKKEWIHKLVDPLSGKSTQVFMKKKKTSRQQISTKWN